MFNIANAFANLVKKHAVFLQTIAAILITVFAGFGLSEYKNSLDRVRAETQYQSAIELLASAYVFRDVFLDVRRLVLRHKCLKIPRSNVDEGTADCDAETINSLSARYEKSWARVSTSLFPYYQALGKARAAIGKELDEPKLELEKCLSSYLSHLTLIYAAELETEGKSQRTQDKKVLEAFGRGLIYLTTVESGARDEAGELIEGKNFMTACVDNAISKFEMLLDDYTDVSY